MMKPTEAQKDSIVSVILLECVKNKSSDARALLSSPLHQRLSSPETRNLVYQCCLDLVEDPQRRRDVGKLLLSYTSSFPPSQAILREINEKCRAYASSRSSYSNIYQELRSVVDAYLFHKPLSYMLGPTVSPGKEALAFRQHELSSNPDYIQKCNLQPSIVQHSEKGKRIVPISNCSVEEFAATAREKNKSRSRLLAVKYHVVGCKDYVNQLPLECTETIIEQQVRVLNSYWERYPSNPAVLRATSFLIKLMCDAYVSKIPLQPNYSFFRSVSICYAPTFFELMGSTYTCVRNHVYDILLTLGMHFQLVDTQGMFPGCTEALENELMWLLLILLKKQSLTDGVDEMTWTAAAKCTLAIIPPSKLDLVDTRALYRFMTLPAIVSFYPQLYTAFAEAFSRRLLRGGDTSSELDENILLEENEFRKLGRQPVARLLFLYRQAMSVSARLALFKVLFVHAAGTAQTSEHLTGSLISSRLSPATIRRCFMELVMVGFHWHLHSLLFYQSHQVFRELSGHITYDMDVKGMREYKAEAVAIVQSILQIIEDDARLPDVIVNAFKNTLGTRVEERPAALNNVLSSCLSMIPKMLKEDNDGVLYNISWRMAFYCMRLSCESFSPERSTAFLEELSDNLVSFKGTKDRLEAAKIRSVCPDVLVALAFLGRKHANQAVDPFGILVERFLLSADPVDTHSVMQLYYRFIGSISIQKGPFKGNLRTDISQMMCSEQLVTAQSVVDGLGSRLLWALYRALCSVQVFAACRARHVLVSLLDDHEEAGSIAPALSWKTVMADPYPPVALVGARKIIQLYGRTAYDRFDEALNIPQMGEKGESVYLVALKVSQLADPRKE